MVVEERNEALCFIVIWLWQLRRAWLHAIDNSDGDSATQQQTDRQRDTTRCRCLYYSVWAKQLARCCDIEQKACSCCRHS